MALIVSELIVVFYLLAINPVASGKDFDSGAFLVFGVVLFSAWIFLFFGSSFLIRSHRWLAILGWCLAVGTLLFAH